MNYEQELESLREEVKALLGAEYKVDYTQHPEGIVVDAYIAQADIDKGITIRGAFPYVDAESTDDVDITCINKHQHIGKTMRDCHGVYMYTIEHYIRDLKEVIQNVADGVYIHDIVPDAGFHSNGMNCAF